MRGLFRLYIMSRADVQRKRGISLRCSTAAEIAAIRQ